jgi:hypothetical protein
VLSLPIANPPPPLLLVINKLSGLVNLHPSATNLARKSLANPKLPLVPFNNSRTTATITFSTLDTLRHRMEHQARYITRVITTLTIPPFQSNANHITR